MTPRPWRRGRAEGTVADRLRAQFAPIPGWAVSVDADTHRVRVAFPHDSGSLDLDPDDWDWVRPAQSKNALTSQYVNSLTYLPLIGEHDPQAAQGVLGAYDRFARSSAFHGLARRRSSWALATASRLEAVSLAVAEEVLAPGALRSSVVDADLEWLQRAEHVPLTNHGFYLVRSALSVALVLEQHGERRAKSVRGVAQAQLPRILEKVFGPDGWSDENSAQHSHQWIGMLDGLLDAHGPQLRTLGLSDTVRRARAAAERTTAVQTFADGTLIPRGDTGLVRTALRPPPGTHHSVRTGVWAHHGPDSSVLTVNGCADIGRKQRDDTSLVFRWRDQDVFLDGGHAGVVKDDMRAFALRRTWGHTCVTSDVLDAPTGEMFADIRDHGWARIEPEPAPPDARAAVTLDRGREGLFRTRRRLVVTDTGLRLVDTWESAQDWHFHLRFLVPVELDVAVRDTRTVELRRDGFSARLTFSADVDVEVVTGEAVKPRRGWRGLGDGSFEPVHSLEVRPRVPGPGLETVVEVAGAG